MHSDLADRQRSRATEPHKRPDGRAMQSTTDERRVIGQDIAFGSRGDVRMHPQAVLRRRIHLAFGDDVRHKTAFRRVFDAQRPTQPIVCDMHLRRLADPKPAQRAKLDAQALAARNGRFFANVQPIQSHAGRVFDEHVLHHDAIMPIATHIRLCTRHECLLILARHEIHRAAGLRGMRERFPRLRLRARIRIIAAG